MVVVVAVNNLFIFCVHHRTSSLRPVHFLFVFRTSLVYLVILPKDLNRAIGYEIDDNRIGPMITFYGSNDFHHLSLAFARRVREPVNIVIFDNHPDWIKVRREGGILINTNARSRFSR